MNTNYQITVLDFSEAKVYNISITKELYLSQTEDYESFLIKFGFSLSNIEWMAHTKEIWTPNNKLVKYEQ